MQRASVLAAAMMLMGGDALAVTIDTNSGYTGVVTENWYGAGQSFTVPTVESRLNDISFYFDPASAGRTFSFTLSDGGTEFFAGDIVITAGINTIITNVDLSPAALHTAYATFYFNGFSGKTIHFGDNTYSEGTAFWIDSLDQTSPYAMYDLRFIANFSDPDAASIPTPATAILLLSAMAGYALMRREVRR